MKHLPILLALPLLAATAFAQSVSLQSIGVTPIGLHATAEIGVQNNVLPTGQQLVSPTGAGAYAAVGLSSVASLSWNGPTQLQDGAIEYRYLAYARVEASAPGTSRSATIDQHQILVSLQPSAARKVRIVAEISGGATAGQTAPRLDADLGDDGFVDGDTVSGGFDTGELLIGGGALPLRLTVGAEVLVDNGQEAMAWLELKLTVHPVNDISITRAGIGCFSFVDFLVNETFAVNGVRMGLPNNPLHVVVLGMTMQPILVPTGFSVPCLLFPAPEAVLLGQPGGITQPIPAAARPFAFHAQAVVLSAFTGELMLTDSYLVSAN